MNAPVPSSCCCAKPPPWISNQATLARNAAASVHMRVRSLPLASAAPWGIQMHDFVTRRPSVSSQRRSNAGSRSCMSSTSSAEYMVMKLQPTCITATGAKGGGWMFR